MKTRTLVLAMLLGGAACGGDEPGTLPEPAGPADVRVSEAVNAAGVESFPATVAAVRKAEVATRLSGTVREVTVGVGSPVGEGGVLVRLDDSDVMARVNAAEARAELARRSFRRVRNLHADGAAAEQELDEARAALEAAEAALRDARAQLEYTVVRAPFDGFVSARMVDPGDLAAPGRPMLRVVGRRALKVEADLPGRLSGRLDEGAAVDVELPAAEVRVPARVTRVVPALEPGSRRFRVEAVFELDVSGRDGVVPGAYARLELPRPGGESRWIPLDAVIRRGQLTGVFAVEAGELRLRWLRLGATRGDAVEVLAAPPRGLTVVREPAPTLRDGQAVGVSELVPWKGPEVSSPGAAGGAEGPAPVAGSPDATSAGS